MKKIYLPNQCYFVTTNMMSRSWVFGCMSKGIYVPNERLCRIIIEVLKYTRSHYQILLHGYVIMPDHLHLLLTTGDESPATRLEGDMPIQSRVDGDSSPSNSRSISEVMHAVKGRSARLVNIALRNAGQLWQHDFYEHSIRNEADFEEKLNYIHANPIRVRLVNNSVDFKYSSYRNYCMNDESVIKIDRLGESGK